MIGLHATHQFRLQQTVLRQSSPFTCICPVIVRGRWREASVLSSVVLFVVGVAFHQRVRSSQRGTIGGSDSETGPRSIDASDPETGSHTISGFDQQGLFQSAGPISRDFSNQRVRCVRSVVSRQAEQTLNRSAGNGCDLFIRGSRPRTVSLTLGVQVCSLPRKQRVA